MKKYIIIFIISFMSVLLSACKNIYQYEEGKVNIVATTTMLGDLSKQIGGDKVAVTTLMGIGIDPHTYSPKASDTNALIKSDFIVYAGLHLEGKIADVLDQLSEEKAALNAGNALILNEVKLLFDNEGNLDPHIWFNVENWIVVAESLIEKLSLYDSQNKDYYTTRGENYIKQLRDLHEWIIIKTSEIDEEKRILITAHDAFQYFADAYGFQVEAIQGISTSSEASIANINDLVNLVIDRQVKSIFIESSVPQKTIDSVISSAKSRNYTLEIGGELYSDSLGDGIDSQYIQAFKNNVNKIVDGLK
ncbi:MAG: zinc ABC transporter substrate-binding protein [Bacilli bacterium]|nr:zinc ABC transporter substrate-binding protein [Bacilli bacterium]MDD2681797.1 zinc ABC transporter substrate-binding protein [Bacilli bacterium]MDD3121112.1 zinc ABC transporter substrate-binding protein [Bacilli bacterium]MDD4063393.1 zinc ABC transporter substrate-binding protein [Bacilli bacterium]MDD4482362.1 zinc ABC transporter substrate-binding protein [Bacilli bacterium]